MLLGGQVKYNVWYKILRDPHRYDYYYFLSMNADYWKLHKFIINIKATTISGTYSLNRQIHMDDLPNKDEFIMVPFKDVPKVVILLALTPVQIAQLRMEKI